MGELLRFAHLQRLTTPLGLREHALLDEPREEHGMCVDDVARGLVVTARVPDPTVEVSALATAYLGFLVSAQHDDGTMHNRRNPDGTWGDAASTGDHWGRALWAFGTASTHSGDRVLVATAQDAAATALRARSDWPRSMAYAALGAAELLRSGTHRSAALSLLGDARRCFRPPRRDRSWPWPDDALTYANAVLPQAMVVTGRLLEDEQLRLDGLLLLEWLLDEQTSDGHLSVVPAVGRRRGDPRPAFDQQPIEVVALAEACRTAFLDSGDDRWSAAVARCSAWFEGDNDTGLAVRDPLTGAGYDGLERDSVNQNRGAESTLAWLATQQLWLQCRTPALP